jgi:hypothetical protein
MATQTHDLPAMNAEPPTPETTPPASSPPPAPFLPPQRADLLLTVFPCLVLLCHPDAQCPTGGSSSRDAKGARDSARGGRSAKRQSSIPSHPKIHNSAPNTISLVSQHHLPLFLSPFFCYLPTMDGQASGLYPSPQNNLPPARAPRALSHLRHLRTIIFRVFQKKAAKGNIYLWKGARQFHSKKWGDGQPAPDEPPHLPSFATAIRARHLPPISPLSAAR